MRTPTPLPPLEELQALMYYDPISGCFTWKTTKQGRRLDLVAGYVLPIGYWSIVINGKRYLAHRMAWLFTYGEDPSLNEIDHINRVRSDNRIVNLRIASRKVNSFNTKRPVTNTSGVKGVCWERRRMKWLAQIKINRKSKFLGYYDNIEDATDVVINARNLLHGVFGCQDSTP